MRINSDEVNAICSVTETLFGSKSKVYLFGSRTDDNKKGGDIDLLIQPPSNIDSATCFAKKLKFLVALKQRIGDQRIDVIIDNGTTDDHIIMGAKENSIHLNS